MLIIDKRRGNKHLINAPAKRNEREEEMSGALSRDVCRGGAVVL